MTKTEQKLKIIVVGAGIAGLSFALAAHQRDIEVHLYERNDRITEVGAGLALGPNSARILAEEFGLKDEFFAISSVTKPPYETTYRRYNTGEPFITLSTGRYQAYNHRADFVKLLAKHIPVNQIHLNRKLLEIKDKVATFQIEDKEEHVDFDILIGADGIHSKVRSLIFSQDKPINSLQVMYRDVINFEDLKGPFEFDLTKTTIWPAPGKRHIVTFPIDQGRRFAAAAVLPVEKDKTAEESWKTEGDLDLLLESLDDFHQDVKNIFKSFKKIKVYGLYDREDLDRWVDGNVLLIGDAAHPGQPHQGANAGQAIEDALALAIILKYSITDPNLKDNISKWLRTFESARKQHAEDVVLTSRRMGHIFNNLVDSPEAIKLIKNNFSWIHDHNVNVEIEKAIFRNLGPEIALGINYEHLN